MKNRDISLIDWSRYIAFESGEVLDKKIKRNLSPASARDGYQQVFMSGRKYLLHRIIAYTFIPNPENKKEVNHKDGNKKNNAASNLEWCTRSENILHSFNTGLNKVRSVSPDQANEIKRLYNTGVYTYQKIAELYSVSNTTIQRIVTGAMYKSCILKW